LILGNQIILSFSVNLNFKAVSKKPVFCIAVPFIEPRPNISRYTGIPVYRYTPKINKLNYLLSQVNSSNPDGVKTSDVKKDTDTSPSARHLEVRITSLSDMTLKTEVPIHGRSWYDKAKNINLNLQLFTGSCVAGRPDVAALDF
jgi:hypothetical protein